MRKLLKLFKLMRTPAYWKGLSHGVAATTEHENFLRFQPFATLIDAGANKGQFSLAARAANPQARIIAFEPLSAPATKFRKVLGADPLVTLVDAALGSEAGEAEIHVSRRIDSSSLLPIGKLQSEIFPGTEKASSELIRVVRFDDALDVSTLPAPRLLKIDVQGFELELLKGAVNSLPLLDAIYMELSFLPLYEGQPLAHAVIGWLSQHGFDLAGVYHVANSEKGEAVQADILFRRRD